MSDMTDMSVRAVVHAQGGWVWGCADTSAHAPACCTQRRRAAVVAEDSRAAGSAAFFRSFSPVCYSSPLPCCAQLETENSVGCRDRAACDTRSRCMRAWLNYWVHDQAECALHWGLICVHIAGVEEMVMQQSCNHFI